MLKELLSISFTLLTLIPASLLMPAGWAECQSNTFSVTLATPVSSRVNNVGDPVEAVLREELTIDGSNALPAGTVLGGKVAGIRRSSGKRTGSLKLAFTRTAGNTQEPLPFLVTVITGDGWLRQEDEGTPIWQPGVNRSTRLLNQKLMRKLTTDRAVWATVLGLNSNQIPDPSTDAFMWDYNRRDVMLGAGDRLQLRTSCF